MPVTVICNPVWKTIEVEHAENLVDLVTSIISLMKRDGIEKACDALCEYHCWSVINDKTDSSPDWIWPENEKGWNTVLVEGYGLAYDDRKAAFGTDELEGVLGIFCNGFMMYTDFEEDESIPIDTFGDEPLAKLEEFFG